MIKIHLQISIFLLSLAAAAGQQVAEYQIYPELDYMPGSLENRGFYQKSTSGENNLNPLDSVILYRFESETDSLPGRKQVYEYDDQANWIRTDYRWDTQKELWLKQERHEYGFDAAGNWVLYSNFIWDNVNETWLNSHRYEWEFDDENKQIASFIFDMDPIELKWRKSSKSLYEYDSQGNRTLTSTYRWDEQQEWIINGKVEYEYDDWEITTHYTWDGQNSIWKPSAKQEFDYDKDGNIIMHIRYFRDDENGTWRGDKKWVYEFDEHGNQVFYALYGWDGENWSVIDQYVGEYKYEFDESGNMTLIHLVNKWKEEYKYNSRGDRYILVRSAWDSENEKWRIDKKYFYYYSYDNAEPVTSFRPVLKSDSTSWDIASMEMPGIGMLKLYARKYTDSTYAELYAFADWASGPHYYYGKIREDTISGKLWVIPPPVPPPFTPREEEEILIMDLTLDVGDTFEFYEGVSGTVDSVYFSDDGRKIIRFEKIINFDTPTNYWNETIRFIEGVGPNISVIWYDFDNRYVTCKYDNDELVYVNSNSLFDGCLPLDTGMKPEQGKESHVKLYPNPASDVLHVEISPFLLPTTEFIIYNTQGVALKHLQVQGYNHTINIGGLSKGLYFVSIKNGSHLLLQKIIIN